MNSLQLLITYFGIINILGFLIMVNDKRRSKKHGFRTPEAVFFILASMGGSIGCIAGMYTFRHTTKHWYFVVFLPLILILQIGLGVAIYYSPIEILFR